MNQEERREHEIKMLAQSALWYAWGQMDPPPGKTVEDNELRQLGLDTEHGLEFMRLYEQVAREYANEQRSSRHNVIDSWREFVLSKQRLGMAAQLTVDDIDYSKRYEREGAAKRATP